MSRRSRFAVLIVVAGTLLLLPVIGWRAGWFVDEPTQEALFALLPARPDAELTTLMERISTDTQQSERVRECADVVLKAWRRAATNSVTAR